MRNRPIISIDNVGKSYLLRHKYGASGGETLRDTLAGAARKLLGRNGRTGTSEQAAGFPVHQTEQPEERFWALRNVSFEINEGDIVGLIGRNGAGKSTLLKILSQITTPTEGQIGVDGRVASLLEVGTGFHQELTGRENIYLNGAILGMSRAEVRSKFDEIVEFAEVEKFLDTPVKRYSSGMYVRLAFAVAAHLEPEILLIDEVLAVGDLQFQKKCLGKMSSVAGEGRTVLFVSHNMSAIRTLCTKCVLLNEGQLEMYDSVDRVTSRYLNAGGSELREIARFKAKPAAPGQFTCIKVLSAAGHPAAHLPHDSRFAIEMDIRLNQQLPNWYLALHIMDEESNTIVFDRMLSSHHADRRSWKPGKMKVSVDIPGPLLVPGRYFVTAHFSILTPPERLDGVEAACSFEIFDNGSKNAQTGLPWYGKVAAPLDWSLDCDECAG